MAVYSKALGKQVFSVSADVGSDLRITFTDKSYLDLGLEGDCCSHSYFTKDAIEVAQDLVGATITSIDEETGPGEQPNSYYAAEEEGSDCVSWHFLKITTNKGYETLDWRNDSNGYYDGWVTPHFVEGDRS